MFAGEFVIAGATIDFVATLTTGDSVVAVITMQDIVA